MELKIKYLVIGVVAALVIALLVWRNLAVTSDAPQPPPVVDVSALKQLALQLRQQGNLEGFVGVLDRIPDQSPEKTRALFEQARAYREMGDAIHFESTALRCANRSDRDSDPQAVQGSLAMLADHYALQERWTEVKEVHLRLIDVISDPDRQKHVLLMLAGIDDDRRDPQELVEWHSQFVKRHPEDADSRRALAVSLTRQGRFEEARSHLKFCVEHHPDDPRFWETWLWFLLQTGDQAAARDCAGALPESCNQNAGVWVHRGRLRELDGKWPLASQCYRRALALDPGRHDANHRLAQSLRGEGKWDEAAEQARRARRLSEAKTSLLAYRRRLLNSQKPPDSAACGKMADLCRALELSRQADAWLALATSPTRP